MRAFILGKKMLRAIFNHRTCIRKLQVKLHPDKRPNEVELANKEFNELSECLRNLNKYYPAWQKVTTFKQLEFINTQKDFMIKQRELIDSGGLSFGIILDYVNDELRDCGMTRLFSNEVQFAFFTFSSYQMVEDFLDQICHELQNGMLHCEELVFQVNSDSEDVVINDGKYWKELMCRKLGLSIKLYESHFIRDVLIKIPLKQNSSKPDDLEKVLEKESSLQDELVSIVEDIHQDVPISEISLTFFQDASNSQDSEIPFIPQDISTSCVNKETVQEVSSVMDIQEVSTMCIPQESIQDMSIQEVSNSSKKLKQELDRQDSDIQQVVSEFQDVSIQEETNKRKINDSKIKKKTKRKKQSAKINESQNVIEIIPLKVGMQKDVLHRCTSLCEKSLKNAQSDKIRKIMIKSSTHCQSSRIFQSSCTWLKNFRPNEWVTRPLVIDNITKEFQIPDTSFRALLTKMFYDDCVFCETTELSKGLLMRKFGGNRVQMRFNI